VPSTPAQADPFRQDTPSRFRFCKRDTNPEKARPRDATALFRVIWRLPPGKALRFLESRATIRRSPAAPPNIAGNLGALGDVDWEGPLRREDGKAPIPVDAPRQSRIKLR